MIDPFGLREESGPAEPAPRPPNPVSALPAASRKRIWAVLLILDTVIVFVCGGTLAGMLYLRHSPAKPWGQWFASESPQQAVPNRVHAAPKTALPTPKTPAFAAPAPPAAQAQPQSKAQAPAPPPAKTNASAADAKKARPVAFECTAKSAKEVLLKGPFLVHYRGGMKKMKKEEGGVWQTSVMLLPGSYKYQCVINGKKYPSKTIEVGP